MGPELAPTRKRTQAPAPPPALPGLSVRRLYTVPGKDPGDSVPWTRRDITLPAEAGATARVLRGIEVPAFWTDAQATLVVSKYFRLQGVPQRHASGRPILDARGEVLLDHERSFRQPVSRIVRTWRRWGETCGYFRRRPEAANFEAEIAYHLLQGLCAPNSPTWFNVGLKMAYGIQSPAQGHWYVCRDGDVKPSPDAYTRAQVHACFVQPIEDNLLQGDGIYALLVREGRLFKYGSGSGTNYSHIRGEGEPLSGGGTSSGLMSFLRMLDTAAGAIKSGGTTRRAAKMVLLDCDHPDVETFVRWKAHEEEKAKALVSAGYTPEEAYESVSGQNSNNTVRLFDQFMEAAIANSSWELTRRVDGKVARTIPARGLLQTIGDAAWACGDPGIQFSTTINDWNTCPASGEIRGSNPCGEYLFLDNTACNLASLNLVKFLDERSGRFDVERFRHAVRLWTIALDISNELAQHPSRPIAKTSAEFRTIGLGFTNLHALLMRLGLPYDSPQGRAMCAGITALMSGEAYATSAELARELGPFPAFFKNRDEMLRVIKNHRVAAYNVPPEAFEGVSITPSGLDQEHCPDYLVDAARAAWDKAVGLGERHGFRNAQVTVLAPTGTISLLMGADTTGIEPAFALTTRKRLSGGGELTLENASLRPALRSLGYSETEVEAIVSHVQRTRTLPGGPHLREEDLWVFATAQELPAVAHLEMVAAAQAFISGGISKTLNLPAASTPDEIRELIVLAWSLGLKGLTVYRDGSKGLQPLRAEDEPPPCPTCGEDGGSCKLPSATQSGSTTAGPRNPRDPERS
ncbi:MAG: vitamin B12-dependent ribonucleotide reductase [Candidatus Aminicenantes bacterium]|nr:vitamin B12-dependent ribonucleotide reductase [Candidatus Aminicenantes bacterium]